MIGVKGGPFLEHAFAPVLKFIDFGMAKEGALGLDENLRKAAMVCTHNRLSPCRLHAAPTPPSPQPISLPYFLPILPQLHALLLADTTDKLKLPFH